MSLGRLLIGISCLELMGREFAGHEMSFVRDSLWRICRLLVVLERERLGVKRGFRGMAISRLESQFLIVSLNNVLLQGDKVPGTVA